MPAHTMNSMLTRSTLFAVCAAACAHASAQPFASAVVYGLSNGEPVTDPSAPVDEALTFGPYHTSGLWNDPQAVLGEPNAIDYDDTQGFGPVEGGFAGGPMRRIHVAWPAWQWGSSDLADFGTRPSWTDGRRKNGLGLQANAQVVVAFAEPIENNPDDGGAWNWGVDFIVHGNPFFNVGATIYAGEGMDLFMLRGDATGVSVFTEPLEVSVAQSASGPWYTFVQTMENGIAVPPYVRADGLWPTQPLEWRTGKGWTGNKSDWTKPVDPTLASSEVVGMTVEQLLEFYDGSAGGTGFDLDNVVDEQGNPTSLPWVQYVRIRDAMGTQGEVCGIADVAAGPPAEVCAADLAAPFGVLNFADVQTFLGAFGAQQASADLAAPAGVFNFADVQTFLGTFGAGCP